MKNKPKIPALRFKGFSEEWKVLKFEEILTVYPFSPFLAKCELDGKYEVIQQGDNPIEGYADGMPFMGFEDVVLFGDHTLSLFKPNNPFFLSSDGVKILSTKISLPGSLLFILLQKYMPKSQGYKRHYTILKKEKASFPIDVKEQTQIGQYFQKLDKLIVLQEQKLTKLSQLKTPMLQKMFPKENADLPEIRFKGFSGKWKEKKVDDVFFFNIPTNTYSRSELDSYVGEIKNIHYGDILIKFGDVVDVLKEEIPFYSKGKVIDFKGQTLKEGDVIFADTAEDETVGKVIELINLGEESIISGLHTIPARPKFGFAKGFLGYYLNSDSFHNQLLPLLQGTKVSSISKTNLKISFLKYPKDKNEQQKISQYFQKLDGLLKHSQLKIEKLKHLKQAMLQKMFV